MVYQSNALVRTLQDQLFSFFSHSFDFLLCLSLRITRLVYIKKGQRRTDLFLWGGGGEMFDLSSFFKKSKIIQIVNSWFVITKLATTNKCLFLLYALVIRKRTNDYDLLQLPNNKNCMKIWFLHPPALFYWMLQIFFSRELNCDARAKRTSSQYCESRNLSLFTLLNKESF